MSVSGPKVNMTQLAILILATLAPLSVTVCVVAIDPTVHWHTSNHGLPSDIQSLTAASLPTSTPGLLSTFYAGTWGDGVYRSTDHGATWIAATAGLTLPMYVRGGLAINPVTPTVLFAGDYYGGLSRAGVYRSTDGGDSWMVSLPDTSIEALLVHPLTPTLVLAGTVEDDLYRSDDSGDSWESADLPAMRVQALAAAPSPPGPIYAGAVSDLYVSANSGISWTLASTLSSTVESLAVHPTTPTLLYAGTRRHGVWRSADGGTSWVTQTVGLPSDAWVTSVALHPVTPTILYAGVWQGQVYRSENGGDTWEDLGYLGTVEVVLIHPTAPSVIYAGTSNNGLFRGSTLHQLTIDPISSPQVVGRPFPITLTARDALGFPLDGPSQAELAVLAEADLALAETLAAGGYDGTTTLADSTGTITPAVVTLSDGVAQPQVTIGQTATGVVITATLSEGLIATSNPFDVGEYTFVYLPLIRKTQ